MLTFFLLCLAFVAQLVLVPIIFMAMLRPVSYNNALLISRITMMTSLIAGAWCGIYATSSGWGIVIGALAGLALSLLQYPAIMNHCRIEALFHLEKSRQIKGFALQNFTKLDLCGLNSISIPNLNDAISNGGWTSKELDHINYMITHIDLVGHVIGQMPAPPHGSPMASLLVYNISREDLETLGARMLGRYGSWQNKPVITWKSQTAQ